MTRATFGSRSTDGAHQLVRRRVQKSTWAAGISLGGLIVAVIKCLVGQL